jgi:hypothetical protein
MFDYPGAGRRAQPEVKAAIRRWRARVSDRTKVSTPLLYWLLGDSTPAYKMTQADSLYGPAPRGKIRQKCGNCDYAFQHVISKEHICSQIEGQIQLALWCRLWVRFDPDRR